MTDPRQIDIADILGPIANGPLVSNHKRKIGEILRHLAKAGLTIEECAAPKYLDREIETLKRYACAASVIFPDYCPRALKPKKEKKARAA